MFLDLLLDPQSPLELVGHLQVGNLHLSPLTLATGSTSKDGTPQKTLLQYPGPVHGKER